MIQSASVRHKCVAPGGGLWRMALSKAFRNVALSQRNHGCIAADRTLYKLYAPSVSGKSVRRTSKMLRRKDRILCGVSPNRIPYADAV